MTLLELVQELAAESGTISPSDITTVVSPTDDHLSDLIRWVIRSNHEIELMHDDWRFRTVSKRFPLLTGRDSYNVAQTYPDFQKIRFYSEPRHYPFVLLEESKCPVRYINYTRWAGEIKTWNSQDGAPKYFTLDPSENLLVYPKPDQRYYLLFDYIREAQVMEQLDDATPLMPERYHRAILFHALVEYAYSDEAQSKMQTAQRQLDRMMIKLHNDQLPEMRFPYQ